MYKGIAGSEGIGIGKVVLIEEKRYRYRCRIKKITGCY